MRISISIFFFFSILRLTGFFNADIGMCNRQLRVCNLTRIRLEPLRTKYLHIRIRQHAFNRPHYCYTIDIQSLSLNIKLSRT